MTENDTFELMQAGRRISEQEIEQISETVELFPRLALKELVATICEHLGWYTAAGGLPAVIRGGERTRIPGSLDRLDR